MKITESLDYDALLQIARLSSVVVIPTLNEEKNICDVIERTLKYTDSILIVDGKSKDKTVELANRYGVDVLIQRGSGKGAAIKEAFQKVDDDIVIMLDGDCSMRPEEIPFFVKGICSGADIVKGSRFSLMGASEDITPIRRVGNSIFILMVNLLYGTSYTDLCYGYIAFRKEFATAVP